jgi:hypothetical protein
MNTNSMAVLAVLLLIISVAGPYLIYKEGERMAGQTRTTGRASSSATISLDIQAIPTSALDINLYNGQNWFSLPVDLLDFRIWNVLNTIGSGSGTGHVTFNGMPGCTGNAADDFIGNYTIIWAYNASDLVDHWKSYTPSKPCFAIPTEDLQLMNVMWNYQIMMNSTAVLHLNGTDAGSVNVYLEDGMNWIGFPRVDPKSVTEAFNSIGSGSGTGHVTFNGMPGCTGNAADDFAGNYTILWSYNASDGADYWKSYTPAKPCFAIPSEDLLMLTPGSGYQIMTNATGTWRVDW